MRRVRVAVAASLAAFVLVGASQATAGVAMEASMEGAVVGIIEDPAAVAARCPPGAPQAIVRSTGSGELTSVVYTGPVVYTEEHCTLLLAMRKDMGLIVAYIRAGEMDITTPAGDALSIAFKAPGVIYGPEGAHRLNGPYAITSGTGIFDGASGHGHVHGLAITTVSLTMNGSLIVPG